MRPQPRAAWKRPLFLLLLLPAVTAVLTSVAASAAFLPVSSAQLTVSEGPAHVPVTCTLNPEADAYVDQAADTSNFGGATELDVYSRSEGGNRRLLLRFELGQCSIPAGATIDSATLNLSMFSAPSIDRTYEAFRVTAPWTEGTVTFANQPAVAATATSSTATGTNSGVVVSWDVLGDVEAFLAGTANNGWRISDGVEDADPSQESRFRSREAAAGVPTLTISFTT